MRKNAWTLVAMIAGGALGGCGGGSGFSTNAPSAAAVMDLQPLDLSRLCDEVNTYATNQLDSPRLCEVGAVIQTANRATEDAALTDAQLQQSCEALAPQLCASLTFPGSPVESTTGFVTVCTLGVHCTATVAQISTCLNDSEAALTTFEQMVPSCSTVTRAKLAGLNPSSLFVQPDSCKPLDAACPNLPQPGLTVGKSSGSGTSP